MLLFALCIVSARCALADCAAELPAQMAFASKTDQLDGRMGQLLDVLMTGNEPTSIPEGCALSRLLLPRYERMWRFAERCVFNDLALQSAGYARDLARKRDMARTYIAKARCGEP